MGSCARSGGFVHTSCEHRAFARVDTVHFMHNTKGSCLFCGHCPLCHPMYANRDIHLFNTLWVPCLGMRIL